MAASRCGANGSNSSLAIMKQLSEQDVPGGENSLEKSQYKRDSRMKQGRNGLRAISEQLDEKGTRYVPPSLLFQFINSCQPALFARWRSPAQEPNRSGVSSHTSSHSTISSFSALRSLS